MGGRARTWTGGVFAAVLALGLASPTSAVADEQAADALGVEIDMTGRADGADVQKRGSAEPQGSLTATSAATSGTKGAVVSRESFRRGGLPAAQTVTRVDVSQTSGGQATATIVFASAPTASLATRVDVQLGTWDGSTCHTAFELRTSTANAASAGFGSGAGWSGTIAATARLSGRTLTASSSSQSAIRTAPWNCAWVLTGIPVGEGLEQGQGFYAEDLAAPRLSVTGGPPVQGAAKGRWVTMRLNVRNTGPGEARGVVLKASGSGLTISPRSRSLGTIKARSGASYLRFKVKPTSSRSAKSRTITFTATASGGHQAKKSFTIARRPAARKYASLSGRYFWGHLPADAGAYRGWQNRAVWFVSKRWAYVGFPKGSTKPTCRSTSSTCKRYTYDRATGTAKIGGQKFKVTTRGFSFRTRSNEPRATFYPLTLPGKGSKISADLIHQDWTGYCTISCTSSTERITLGTNGRFLRSAFSIGSWPGLGQNWASVPPDQRGTYRITAKGRIELRYADGSTRRQVIGIEHDVRGKPSPAGAGLVIGDTNFYFRD